MSDKMKILTKMIRKIVKEEMEKNLKSMMFEEIGRAAIQGKSLNFLHEEVDQKEEKRQIIKETPKVNKAELRTKLLEKLGIDQSNPMSAAFDDVKPIDPFTESQGAEDPDDAGVDPSLFMKR